MIESEPNDTNTNKHRPDKKVGYLKMKVIEDLSADTINKELEKSVKQGTNSVSDDYSSYKKLPQKLTILPKK